ncbi:MAG TPA: bifunctional tetrahydrofolate synthase/dihydrofolate synthase [Rudaea sp.]
MTAHRTFETLADWLDYQQRIHPRSIELGLARTAEVWRRMGAPRIAPVVITVGGTNGKGSTVAFLEAMLIASGRRVGAYTSPHLLRYNERVRVDGNDVDDAILIEAFEAIERARGSDAPDAIALTYFEFGTLAALWIFAQSGVDAAVLEVGLGGRLDAVNIVDADAMIVTTVDLDHQDWLGNDRDSIGREKAGIFRRDRPAILGEREPSAGLLAEADRIGARLVRAGSDFHTEITASGWMWRSADAQLAGLPIPTLTAPVQIDNAAAAIAAWHALRNRLGWPEEAIAQGARRARVAARLQRVARPGAADIIIDVAHNPQAAQVLARWLGDHPIVGRTFAVFGALSDKDIAGIVAPLAARFDAWFLGGLNADTPRGLPAAALAERVLAAAPEAPVSLRAGIGPALDAAAAQAHPGDRVIAFGSFFVAAAAMTWTGAATVQPEAERPRV